MRIRTGFVALVVLGAAASAAQAGEGFAGAYGGFTLGAHSQKSEWYTTEVRYRDGTRIVPAVGGANSTFPNGTATALVGDTNESFKDKAYAAGLVLGYNWQLADRIIVGIEAAMGAAPTYDKGSSPAPGLGTATGTNSTGATVPLDPTTFAAAKTSKPLTLGLTVGFEVVPGTLAYVRGNAERLRVTGIVSSTSCPVAQINAALPAGCLPTDTTQRGGSEKLNGFSFGAGVEHKFGEQLGVRLEYKRAEYGKTKSMEVFPEAGEFYGVDALIDMQKANIVELGVLFHF
jgi:opacity protein-like surface antigen